MRTTKKHLLQEYDWDRIPQLIQDEYSMTIRECCQLLKVSRTWVSRFIRPYCRYIYIAPKMAAVLNYTGVIDCMDSVWMNKEDVYDVVLSSISSVTRQTIVYSGCQLLPSGMKRGYLSAYERVCEQLKKKASTGNLLDASLIKKEQRDVLFSYLSERQIKLLQEAWRTVDVTHRSITPHTPVILPCKEISNWNSVHDMKTYGDNDEMIYRGLYKSGAIKIVVSVVGEDSCAGEKVYYYTPALSSGEGYSYVLDAGVFRYEEFTELY